MKNDNNFSGQTIALNLKNLKNLSINQILFHLLGVGGDRQSRRLLWPPSTLATL